MSIDDWSCSSDVELYWEVISSSETLKTERVHTICDSLHYQYGSLHSII